jgi:hypothetical protein
MLYSLAITALSLAQGLVLLFAPYRGQSSGNSPPLFTNQRQQKYVSHKQLCRRMLVTGFGYLVAIIIIIIIIITSNLSDMSTAFSITIPPLNAIYSFLLQMRVSSPVSKHLSYMLSQFLERDYPGKVIMW